jgi:hypothetical protein
MMFSCLTQFEIEDEQLELARALEVPEEGENEKISPTLEGINPISDTEEGKDKVRLSVRAGKRRKCYGTIYNLRFSKLPHRDATRNPPLSYR